MILGQEDQKVGQWNIWSISMWKVCGVLVVCKLFDIRTLLSVLQVVEKWWCCWVFLWLQNVFFSIKTKHCLNVMMLFTIFLCIVLDFKSLQFFYNGYNQVVPKLIGCLCWFYKGWWIGCCCGPRHDCI
jgi:hypothetical protein